MKRHSVLTLTLGTLLLGGGVAATAQYRDPGYRDNYGNRDNYGRDGSVVDRVMRDTDIAARNSYLNRGEQQRLLRVREDLQRFDERSRRGQWDQGRLDNAISNLSKLADSRRLNPRDRQMMFEDANLLRGFRASRGRYNSGQYGGFYRR